jgi:flagellar hook-length control protein FliK
LLKPRNEKPAIQPLTPIKDFAQLHGGQKADLQTEEAFIALDEGGEQKPMLETSQLSGLSAKQMLDQLVQPGQHHQGQGQVHIQGFEAAKGLPQAPMVQLSNGYQIPESQIFDQVVTQISGSVNGESGRMVLRLQPAELGSLKLELKIEGDRVQAHLHAQTHQVQDVLERNLPQLRSALAEQGLKIDQFLVNVDQRQAEGQFEGQAQYQQQGSERHSDWNQQDHGNEEQMIPLAHLMQNGGGGISLHV